MDAMGMVQWNVTPFFSTKLILEPIVHFHTCGIALWYTNIGQQKKHGTKTYPMFLMSSDPSEKNLNNFQLAILMWSTFPPTPETLGLIHMSFPFGLKVSPTGANCGNFAEGS